MKFRYRLLIIIPLSIIFVIMAPGLILYGQGYRYDWQNKRLSKTGSFFVDSVPRDAQVLINGQIPSAPWYQQLFVYKKFLGLTKINSNTPTVVSNLLPNKYQLIITKDGYQPWQKELEIQAEKTTNTGKIYLFLEKIEPELLLIEKISKLLSIDNGKQIIYSVYNSGDQTSQIKSIKPDQNPVSPELITKIKGAVLSLEIADRYLVAKTATNFYLINLTNHQEIISLNSLIQSPQKIMLLNNSFYVQSGYKIYQLDPVTKKNDLFFDLTKISPIGSLLKDWTIHQDYLLVIKQVANNVYLDKIKIGSTIEKYNQQSIIFSLLLPNYKFKINPQQINEEIIILTTEQDFWVIDPGQKTNYIIARNSAKQIIIQSELNQIISYNDFEISLSSASKEFELWKIKNVLINRRGNQINQVICQAGNNYLIIVNKNNTISAIELDGRNVRNYYQLAQFNFINNVWTNSNPGYLYVWGKIKNQEGVWRLKVQ